MKNTVTSILSISLQWQNFEYCYWRLFLFILNVRINSDISLNVLTPLRFPAFRADFEGLDLAHKESSETYKGREFAYVKNCK